MKNGIYNDLSITDYHANKTHISSSAIKEAKESMLHFKYYMDKEQEHKSCFDFGNAFEVALLMPDRLSELVAVFDHRKRPEPDKIFRGKNKVWKEKFFEDNKDKYVINYDGGESFELIKNMVAACKKDAVINKVIQNVDFQKSIFWTDKKSGLKLKTRPDIVKINKRIIIDAKSCKDASPNGFARDACKLNYPIQAMIQIRGCEASRLIKKVDNYYWLAVQKSEPYCAALYSFEPDDQEYTSDMLDFILGKIKQAKEENLFPGYTERADNPYGVLSLNIPPYYYNDI